MVLSATILALLLWLQFVDSVIDGLLSWTPDMTELITHLEEQVYFASIKKVRHCTACAHQPPCMYDVPPAVLLCVVGWSYACTHLVVVCLTGCRSSIKQQQ